METQFKRYIAKSPYGMLLLADGQAIQKNNKLNNNLKFVKWVYLVICLFWIPGFYKLYNEIPNTYTLIIFLTFSAGVLLVIFSWLLFPDGERISELIIQGKNIKLRTSNGIVEVNLDNSDSFAYSFVLNKLVGVRSKGRLYTLRPCLELNKDIKTILGPKNKKALSLLIIYSSWFAFIIFLATLFLFMQSFTSNLY